MMQPPIGCRPFLANDPALDRATTRYRRHHQFTHFSSISSSDHLALATRCNGNRAETRVGSPSAQTPRRSFVASSPGVIIPQWGPHAQSPSSVRQPKPQSEPQSPLHYPRPIPIFRCGESRQPSDSKPRSNATQRRTQHCLLTAARQLRGKKADCAFG
jgi:hypothetical protein